MLDRPGLAGLDGGPRAGGRSAAIARAGAPHARFAPPRPQPSAQPPPRPPSVPQPDPALSSASSSRIASLYTSTPNTTHPGHGSPDARQAGDPEPPADARRPEPDRGRAGRPTPRPAREGLERGPTARAFAGCCCCWEPAGSEARQDRCVFFLSFSLRERETSDVLARPPSSLAGSTGSPAVGRLVSPPIEKRAYPSSSPALPRRPPSLLSLVLPSLALSHALSILLAASPCPSTSSSVSPPDGHRHPPSAAGAVPARRDGSSTPTVSSSSSIRSSSPANSLANGHHQQHQPTTPGSSGFSTHTVELGLPLTAPPTPAPSAAGAAAAGPGASQFFSTVSLMLEEPHAALPKALWKADADADVCDRDGCNVRFGMFTARKHHCRK